MNRIGGGRLGEKQSKMMRDRKPENMFGCLVQGAVKERPRMESMPELRNLRRSTAERLIGGVCAGIAEWLGWKTSTVRVLFVLGSFVPIIPGFVVYVILWAIVPARHQQ